MVKLFYVFVLLIPLYARVPDVTLNIDWDEYLGKHNPEWTELPSKHKRDTPIIGNGLIGTYLYQDAASGEIRFEMSRNDMCDVRSNFAVRKANGYFKLTFPAGKPTGTVIQNLWDAQIEADLTIGNNLVTLTAFTDARSDAIVFKIVSEIPFNWDFVPEKQVRPSNYIPYPNQVRSQSNGIWVSTQDMPVHERYSTQNEPAPSQHATAWKVVKDGTVTYIYTTVTHTFRRTTARTDAINLVDRASQRGFASLQLHHQSWWHHYHQKSYVSLPEEFERWHWMQMYNMACMSRPNSHAVADLIGPWYDQNLQWNGLWLNWNAQKHYSAVFTSNHPEISDAVLNWAWRHKQNFYDSRSGGYSLYAGGVSMTNPKYGPHASCLPWLMILAWQRYQVTMDTRVFDKMVPLLMGAYKYIMHYNVLTNSSGRFYLKELRSHEYRHTDGKSVFEHATFQVATLRWICNTIVTISNKYGTYKAEAADCRNTLSKLLPYHIDPNEGFMIGKNTKFARPHRHDSHELAVWPYHEYLPTTPDKTKVIRNTIDTHRRIGFEHYGMAETSVGLMSAMIEDGDDALVALKGTPTAIMNNTSASKYTTRIAYSNGYAAESSFMAGRLIQDMLMQSWGDGIIRIFPAIPNKEEWNNLSIHKFRAKGAFLISAKREDKKTKFVKVESLAGEPVTLKTDLGNDVKVQSNYSVTITKLSNGMVRINNLKKDQWCILYNGNEIPDLTLNSFTVPVGERYKSENPVVNTGQNLLLNNQNSNPIEIKIYNSRGEKFAEEHISPNTSWSSSQLKLKKGVWHFEININGKKSYHKIAVLKNTK